MHRIEAQMARKIGEVAYELELLKDSRIHNVFHVSILKKVLGKQVTPCEELPPLNDEGNLVLEPEAILDRRERRLRNKKIQEVLIKWKGLPLEDSTWERSEVLPPINFQVA
jgi:hypothetical protein